MFKAGLLVVVSVFLAGCVSTPHGPWDSLREQAGQCFYDLEKDPELASIAEKVMLVHSLEYAKEPHLELTKIKDFPDPEERKVIRKWAAKLKVCYKIRAAHYVYESPRVAKVSMESDAEQQQLVTELYKGNLSFGQFASRRIQLDSNRSSRFVRAVNADIEEYEAGQRQPSAGSRTAPSSSSACGYEGSSGSYRWVCRQKSSK